MGGGNPLGGLVGGLLGGGGQGGAGGGGIGGLLGMVGGLAQTLAPLANFILPGIGPLIANFGGQALQGIGNTVSKMEEEAQSQKQLDQKEAYTHQAARGDMAAAAAA